VILALIFSFLPIDILHKINRYQFYENKNQLKTNLSRIVQDIFKQLLQIIEMYCQNCQLLKTTTF